MSLNDVTVTKGERTVAYERGYTTGDFCGVYGGRVPHAPERLAGYQINYTGVANWNTWQNEAYTSDYRPLLSANRNAQDTVNLLMARNKAPKSSAVPINMASYVIQTQQVLMGGGPSGY